MLIKRNQLTELVIISHLYFSRFKNVCLFESAYLSRRNRKFMVFLYLTKVTYEQTMFFQKFRRRYYCNKSFLQIAFLSIYIYPSISHLYYYQLGYYYYKSFLQIVILSIYVFQTFRS